MKQWNSPDELLDFAIANEEAAAQFYRDLAGRVSTSSMRVVFEGFAVEEEGHKAKLLDIKRSGRLSQSTEKVRDLKIGEYLVVVEPDAHLDYQHALILAMKQEKAAFKLYTDLAAATDDPHMHEILAFLAQEEAKHKLRFELEYDEEILKEN